MQEYHYYPFGMEQGGTWVAPQGLTQKYKYNGKEYFGSGLGWYDFGARWYDASIGRFTGVDPIAEKFPHVSPFNYAENEPIANIDLWGLQAYRWDGSGEIDKKGIIRDVSDREAESSFGGALVRVTFQVLDFTQVNRLDNAIEDLSNGVTPAEVVETVNAANSILVLGKPSKASSGKPVEMFEVGDFNLT